MRIASPSLFVNTASLALVKRPCCAVVNKKIRRMAVTMPDSVEETCRPGKLNDHHRIGSAIKAAIHSTRNNTQHNRSPKAGTDPRESSMTRDKSPSRSMRRQRRAHEKSSRHHDRNGCNKESIEGEHTKHPKMRILVIHENKIRNNVASSGDARRQSIGVEGSSESRLNQ